MAYSPRYRTTAHSFSSYFPPGVKWLLIVNIGLFILYFLAVRSGLGALFQHFALVPAAVVELLAVWQLVTYLFLHDPGGFSHILGNMFMLWMFGTDLERAWGTKRFLQYYFLCGIGAGLCVVAGNALAGTMNTRTIGCSGAIYGLLLAYGMLWPDRVILFNFLFPIKAKYFVMIMGAIAFLSSFGSSDSGVSHIAHLGGMIFGYLFLKRGRLEGGFWMAMERRYQVWKLQRAKARFRRYLHKHGPPDRNRHVN